MYQFSGKAKLFNGHYWRPVELREKASSLPAALSRGIRAALKQKPKGERIIAMQITMERLGKIMDVGSSEDDNCNNSCDAARDDSRAETS